MRHTDGWVFEEPHSQQAQTALATVSVVRVGFGRAGRRTRVRRGRREHANTVKWARVDARSHFSLKKNLPCAVEEAREDFIRAPRAHLLSPAASVRAGASSDEGGGEGES